MNFRILFLLLLASISSQAQNAFIRGNVSLLPGREVRLLSISDPISKTENTLDIDTLNTEGDFELQAELDKYKSLIIAINRYKAPIYIGPADSLGLQFSSEQKYKLADSWLKGSFDYVFTQTDAHGVNKEISRFDGAYYFFFIQNARFIGTSELKNKISDFEKEFAVPDTAHPFLRVYTKYSIAEMKLSNGFNKKKVFEEYLAEDSLHVFNPAWFSFFENFYADYFSAYDNRFGGVALYNQLNTGISLDSLNTLLDEDEYLKRRDIRQLVILNSIAEAYSAKKYKKQPLEEILKAIMKSPDSELISNIANNLNAKWRKLNDKIKLEYLKNEYAQGLKINKNSLPTLLITSLSGGPQLYKEIAVIEDLQKRYPGIFNVVELHLGVNVSSRSRTWPMVMLDKNYEFLSDFQIYSIPHFMWFDSSNRLELNPVTKPSEGLEEMLYKLKSEKERENKIRIGK